VFCGRIDVIQTLGFNLLDCQNSVWWSEGVTEFIDLAMNVGI